MSRIFKIIFFGLSVMMFSQAQATEQSGSTVMDLSTLMNLEQLMPSLTSKRVVFVGETHDRYDHHLKQLAIIKHQYQHHLKLAIGLEFIQQPFQSVLDDYVAGNIDEAEMLENTEYFDRWRYDFRLYRPIFKFARENAIPLVALNIDRDITDQVKRAGLESLSDAQKSQLPAAINREDQAYRERLEAIFQHHPNPSEQDFERFIDIQLLWDESMAERAAQWLQQHPDDPMVVLAGSGHIMYGSGIPNRLQRRVDGDYASVINLSEAAAVTADMGDYVILSAEQALPPAGKLGAILDSGNVPPSIIDFAPGSGAKQAGLKKRDSISRIDGEEIQSYADIRIALLDRPVDDVVTIEVSRKRLFGGYKTHQFEVTLK